VRLEAKDRRINHEIQIIPNLLISEADKVFLFGGIYIMIKKRRNISNQQLDVTTKEMGVKGMETLFMKLTFKYFLKKGAYTQETNFLT
jgi:hypothetical protein